MERIELTTGELLQAVKNGESISIIDGQWERRWQIIAWIRSIFGYIFGWNDTVEAAHNFAVYLLENPFEQNEKSKYIDTYTAIVHAFKLSLADYAITEEKRIRASQLQSPRTPLNMISSELAQATSPRNVTAELDQVLSMYTYLNLSQKTISQTKPLQQNINWLQEELRTWQEEIVAPKEDFFANKMAQSTAAKIKRSCQYPQFIDALRENRTLLELFFYTVFSNMPSDCTDAVDLFIQAPYLQKELTRCNLDIRIKAIANRGLRFIQTSDDPIQKDVQLLINGKYQSIAHSQNNVTIAHNVKRTVKEVFDTFEEHNRKIADLEYVQKGIMLLDGTLSTMDLSSPEWYKDLPIVERLTRKELEERYETNFQTGHALFVVRASRP